MGDAFRQNLPHLYLYREVLATVAEGDRADVDITGKAARKAFDSGPWRKMSPSSADASSGNRRLIDRATSKSSHTWNRLG